MVLLGHLHTHEFAVGGTTDQVGSPWALDRSAGGSSGGSAAALAARMVPAATGTDTAGSLRIPSALSGTCTIKPTRGHVSLAGIVPLGTTLDHAGPMARTLADCGRSCSPWSGRNAAAPRLAPARARAQAPRTGARPLAGIRLAVSPRLAAVDVDPDVADGFRARARRLRASRSRRRRAAAARADLDLGEDYLDVVTAELLAYHRRFDGRRELYRPSLREWVEKGERRALSGGGLRRRPGAPAGADGSVGRLARRGADRRGRSSRPSRSSRPCAATATTTPAAISR